MRMRAMLTLDDARKALAAAEREARAQSWAVSVAVVDAGGELLSMARMDGAPLMSAQVSHEKARAVVMTGKSGSALEQMVNNGRFAALALPLMLLEGGLPIVVDGDVVGGVGVSGVLPGQDAQVAGAGIAALVAAPAALEPALA